MSDKNFKSYDGAQENVTGSNLDPVAEGWLLGSWDDTCRFYKRQYLVFKDFFIADGGREDCVDVSNHNDWNIFKAFLMNGFGKYILTLKGQSSNNVFSGWWIGKNCKVVDIEIGNWHDQDLGNYPALSKDNLFDTINRSDGKPVTYCYRWGCRPTFINSKVKHLWWRSIGITIYWHAKYLYLTIFGKKTS